MDILNKITKATEYLCSSDIISAIDDLETDLLALQEDEVVDLEAIEDIETDLEELKDFAEEFEGCADWQYGLELIPESDFTNYIEMMVDDTYDIPESIKWYIDWDKLAEDHQADYVIYGGYCALA